jgi:hypothetical protein
MNTPIVITAQTVAPTLAPSILLAHADMERHARGALEAARRAGELLQRAKADLRHGAWLPWLAARMALASLDLVMQDAKAGNGVIDLVLKPRFHNKPEAIVTMLKAHGKVITKVEKGKPGEFEGLSRDELRELIEKELAPAAGLHLVASKK